MAHFVAGNLRRTIPVYACDLTGFVNNLETQPWETVSADSAFGADQMMVLFTHCCPHCGRKRRIQVQVLGQPVRCIQCGGASIATDPHNESLAMMDSVKEHAELTDLASLPETYRHRVPR